MYYHLILFQGSVDVPSNLVGRVIGPQGATVKAIMAACGPDTRINFDRDTAGTFTISASNPRTVEKARVGILKAAGVFCP